MKYPPDNAGDIRDAGSVPGLGRSEGMATHSSSFCLENPRRQRSLVATVLTVAKSQAELKQLGMHTDKIIVTFWRTYFPEWSYIASYCVLFKGRLLSIQNAV